MRRRSKILTLMLLLPGMLFCMSNKPRKPRWFDGKRMVYSCSIVFKHPVEAVFPLLCPVREYEWMASWKGTTVYTKSGFAEKYVVFYHGIPFPLLFKKAYWTATQYVPNKRIQWVITVPDICLIVIDEYMHPLENKKTKIDYTYTITGLSNFGNKVISQKFTEKKLLQEIRRTQLEIEYYIDTGKMLGTEYKSEMFD